MIPVFEAEADAAGLARAWRLLWIISGTTGALEDAADAASRVVDIATRSGDSRLAARAAVAYAQAALLSAMPVTEALDRSQRLADAVGRDRIAEARFLAITAVFHAMQGQFQEARGLYSRSHDIVAELGASVTVAGASLESSRVEMLAGDPSAAERELRRDYVTLEAMGEGYYRSSVAGFLAQALYALDRMDEAEQFAAIAEGLSGADDVASQVTWRTARARILAHAGRADEAVAYAREAVAMASSGSYVQQHAEALIALADVLRRSPNPELQGPPLREALELLTKKGDEVSSAAVRSQLEALAESRLPSS
jgi:tetratricopeptide (TPR) repeat protein